MLSFVKISRTVFNLQCGHEYLVEMAMFNVQRAITPKVGKPELWFMCSACPLIELYICENISDGIRVMERTRMMEALTEDRQTLKISDGTCCCVEVLRPSQPNWVMSSAVSLPNHTFTAQA